MSTSPARATLDFNAFAQSSHGLSAVIKMGADLSSSCDVGAWGFGGKSEKVARCVFKGTVSPQRAVPEDLMHSGSLSQVPVMSG